MSSPGVTVSLIKGIQIVEARTIGIVRDGHDNVELAADDNLSIEPEALGKKSWQMES